MVCEIYFQNKFMQISCNLLIGVYFYSKAVLAVWKVPNVEMLLTWGSNWREAHGLAALTQWFICFCTQMHSELEKELRNLKKLVYLS